MDLAVSHMVLAPLASRILEEAGVDEVWRHWAATRMLTAERDARLCAKAARKTVDILVTEGLSPVILKGPSLSFGKSRDVGDVDLLISDVSLMNAISLLEAAGYKYLGYERNGYIRKSEYRDWDRLSRWSVQFEFSEPDTGTLVELHTAFFETERIYAEDFSALRAAIGDFVAASIVDPETGYRFLALEDRVLLLALHAGAKRSPGNRHFVLRHILDLGTLIDAGLDWDALEVRAFRYNAAHHLLLLLRLFEPLAGSDKGIPSGYMEGIEERLDPRMVRLVRLHLRCFVDLKSFSYVLSLAYRFVSPFVLRSTLRSKLQVLLVLPMLFPQPYRLAEIYRMPRRAKQAYLFYLFEPLRWLTLIVRKAVGINGNK